MWIIMSCASNANHTFIEILRARFYDITATTSEQDEIKNWMNEFYNYMSF